MDIRLSTGATKRIDMPLSVWSIALSPDGSTYALGTEGEAIRLCNSNLEVQRKLSFAKVTRLLFHPDGATLSAISETGSLRQWQWADRLDEINDVPEKERTIGRSLWALTIHPTQHKGEALTHVKFIDDSTLLVGCESGRIFQMHIEGTGTELEGAGIELEGAGTELEGLGE